MATYYVKTTGDDSLSGLSEALAWLTITKMVQTLVAGDTCYIAPGTYRNTSGWSVTNAGTSDDHIVFEGDPDCEQFDDENPGYVRLTGCNASEDPACGAAVFDASLKAYVELNRVVVDGVLGNFETVKLNATGGLGEDCIVVGGGSAGFKGGTYTHCVAIAAKMAFWMTTSIKCLVLGCREGWVNSFCENCLALGGSNGFRPWSSGNTTENCIAMGSRYGFYEESGTDNPFSNCIAIGSLTGFYNGTVNHCISMGCNTGFYQGALTACKAVYCTNDSSGTSGDAVTAANHIGWTNLRILKELSKWIKPDLFFEKDGGDDSILAAETEDILGEPRRMGDNTIDVGPFEHSDVSMLWDSASYNTSPPGIKILRKGCQDFNLPAKKSVSLTVEVYVKFDAGATLKPQLILSGNGVTTQTSTATGSGSSFEKLSVEEIPDCDTVLTVRLYQRDYASGKYCIFSDLKVA